MAGKNQKLHCYIVRYHNLDSLAFYTTRFNVTRSEIRAYAKELRLNYEFVFVAEVDHSL